MSYASKTRVRGECLAFPRGAESQLRDSTGLAPVSSVGCRGRAVCGRGLRVIANPAAKEKGQSSRLSRGETLLAGEKGDEAAHLGDAGATDLRDEQVLVVRP